MGAGEKKPHPQPQLQPHPRPLSEWRGEWRPLFANKEGVSLVWRKALFNAKKRPLQIKKGVSLILLKASPSPSEGGDVFLPRLLLNSKTQLSLFPLTILFYPTSSVHAPLHSERGWGWGCSWVGGEAGCGRGWGLPSVFAHAHKKKRTPLRCPLCDSDRIQTCNLLIRSQVLYSVELRNH